ncbi:hypothetical protein N0V83_003253 [Neocucurbitaria cava]|uniref:Uncharacterized protein n=1 Tax=Neocucurbitaria cava TaxID=798079 RepID=A0A9W9CP94_9PLEO|nr:hypothetical protein N0V83_003253 [Neocucurbitaria cava]
MASKAPSWKLQTKSPLLCLPGEIRNAIYTFVQEGSTREIVCLGKDISANPRDDDWFHKCSRQDWGLTQVCQCLRHEYLPIHRSQTKYNIRHINLEDYMKIFILGGGIVKEENAVGHLVIAMGISYNYGADILPLMKLHKVANSQQQQLSISVHHEGRNARYCATKDLEQFFKLGTNVKLRKFVKENVRRIWACESIITGYLNVTLSMKSSFFPRHGLRILPSYILVRGKDTNWGWEAGLNVAVLAPNVWLVAEDVTMRGRKRKLA